MFIGTKLVSLASLAAIALGAPPVPGAPYRIQSVGSSLVFDDISGLANPGNVINVFPINNSGPGPQAQLMSVELVGTNLNAGGNAGSGLYRFKFPLIGISAYVRGPPAAGLGLNAQNFSTEFIVTELALGVFTITYPFSNFALTSPTAAATQITLQPLSATNALQQWRFISASV